MDKYFEKTLSSEAVCNGKVVDFVKDMVELSDGLVREREIIVHPGGVVVVVQKGDKLLLVKQYRYPIKQTQFELPAGRLEVGEDPFEAIKRELLEETGYRAKSWESLGFIYTSPGICTEKLYLYKASDLSFEGENPDEGEIIDCFEFEKEKVFEMIKTGEINDAKTICGIMRAFCYD